MAVAKKDPNKALELLKAFADKPNAQPPERDERLFLVAAHLEALSRQFTKPAEKPVAERFVRQAETFYRASVEKGPAHRPEWLLFLARQGRTDEAIDVLDRICDKCSPAVLGRIVSVVAHGKASKDQRDRLSRILQAAMKRSDRPVPLLMAMADLCARQSRNTEAQDLYREVLQKNSDNTNAMTSLAVLLAQQGIKLDESLKLANQAIEIVGPVGMALDSRVRLPGPW